MGYNGDNIGATGITKNIIIIIVNILQYCKFYTIMQHKYKYEYIIKHSMKHTLLNGNNKND
jgi:hypothetical protein